MATHKETWIQRNWRPLAALTYLIINLFDFIVAPIWVGMTKETTSQLVNAIVHLNPTVQAIMVAPKPGWQPLTLLGGGIFHISFGAILGVAAWTHGSERIEQLRMQGGYSTYRPNGQTNGYGMNYGQNDQSSFSGYNNSQNQNSRRNNQTPAVKPSSAATPDNPDN